MHEMSVAQNIVEIVHQHLPEDPGVQVQSVHVRIGEFAGVVPESLEFCFTALTQGTPLQGASLDIENVPLMARCQTCNVVSRLTFGVFVCPECGGSNVSLISGNEMQITEIILHDNAGPAS